MFTCEFQEQLHWRAMEMWFHNIVVDWSFFWMATNSLPLQTTLGFHLNSKTNKFQWNIMSQVTFTKILNLNGEVSFNYMVLNGQFSKKFIVDPFYSNTHKSFIIFFKSNKFRCKIPIIFKENTQQILESLFPSNSFHCRYNTWCHEHKSYKDKRISKVH